MEENWIEVIVRFRNPLKWENKRRVALKFVKPTLEELWKRKAIRFFHYFFEPELHLRLYSERDNFEEIKAVIKKESNLFKTIYFAPLSSTAIVESLKASLLTPGMRKHGI